MTPEVARREVKAAREAGWYQMTWDMKYKPPGPAAKRRRVPGIVERTELRVEILRAIAAGHETLRAMSDAIKTAKTKDQVSNAFARLRIAAPWLLNVRTVGCAFHVTLTDAGRAQLEAWK